ncbi:hypothetical protein IMG5_123170 [Ichthyophthirius multifiliis]|uniref:Cilia- and flagella-associated protein 58 central coiled coil domain-containing protein n=1 Tax=Ichthyophthirius multifiliis TaxID=5932 RepID=G0QVE6_ICHMU|nr:hypothetical protein IMG5_123170 [Ichthyophthirius multifiliis]EGR30803.1 hypothetical protein IMG5_123170 [Ichthyophthirius multifiliis]|eukprot:XP_004032390.1 hypothetical protein IMG5_123170 [Ichthyophthirius multifiliis]
MQNQDQLIGIENQAFEVLEREFQEVLNDLAADQSLDRFRQEFEKFHRALKVSQENEKRLLAKCREYTQDIGNHTSNLQGALKMTQEDNTTITHLKQELEKTYKILELSKDREEKSKQKVENLYSEIQHLNQLIEKGSANATGQTANVHDMLIAQEELLKECTQLKNTITDVAEDINSLNDKIRMAENEKGQIQNEYNNIQQQKQELELLISKDDQQKKQIQQDLENIKKEYESQKKKQNDYISQKGIKEKTQIDNKISIKKQQIQNNDLVNKKLKAARKSKEELIERLDKVTNDILEYNSKIQELLENERLKDQQLEYENNRYEQLSNQKYKILSQIKESQDLKEISERTKEAFLQGINMLESDIQDQKKRAFEDRSLLEELRRNRDILQKEIDRADTNNKKQEEEVIQLTKTMKEKINEFSGMNKQMDKLNYQIGQLKKEKEKYGIQASSANAKYFHALEEIKLKDNLISEFQKKNIETQAKLKQQQNLYETVRQESNLYSKNLTETQEDLEEIKRKQKTVNQQISQLKEEIDSKQKNYYKNILIIKKKMKLVKIILLKVKNIKKKSTKKNRKQKLFNKIQLNQGI